MTRHFVAVCVFCLLCAEHFPCKGHPEIKPQTGPMQLNNPRTLFLKSQHDILGLESPRQFNRVATSRTDLVQEERKRLKRHVHRAPERDHVSQNVEKMLEQVVAHYGQQGSVDMWGFEAMLKQLGLTRLVQKTGYDHECRTSFYDVVRRMTRNSALPATGVNSRHEHSRHDHEDDSEEDYQPPDTTRWRLDADALWNICPLFLYQLSSADPSVRQGCLMQDLVAPSGGLDHFDGDEHEENRIQVWTYSVIAVLGVSLCGLFGVAVIPCMDKHFYHHAIQFFVALAIGTLCGDALLHLVPHSMIAATEMSHEEAHTYMMWKGLTAVFGIIFFYFIERALIIISGRWAKRKQNGKPPSKNLNVIRDPESNVQNNVALSDKQCKHKYSSSPYCYNEIAMETREEQAKLTDGVSATATEEEKLNHRMNHLNHNACPKHGEHVHDASDQKLLSDNGNYSTISDNYKILGNSFSKDVEETSTSGANDTLSVEGAKVPLHATSENYTIILREHQTKHHGHSHTHGHVHAPPESLSAVAWMVIMGDGLHNFTDGMAIGAAFSNNIAGGFSTAIAVFCHELPHELGDFAVLLKAGMTAKQAVFYNILSSVLSFIGMIVGVIVGDTPEASAWIFAAAAGMFLYIALVDMIPELTSSHGKEERCQFSESILQFLGMFVGFGIMLVISVYEHDLKKMFTNDHHHH